VPAVAPVFTNTSAGNSDSVPLPVVVPPVTVPAECTTVHAKVAPAGLDVNGIALRVSPEHTVSVSTAGVAIVGIALTVTVTGVRLKLIHVVASIILSST